jgi:hypothetical protein
MKYAVEMGMGAKFRNSKVNGETQITWRSYTLTFIFFFQNKQNRLQTASIFLHIINRLISVFETDRFLRDTNSAFWYYFYEVYSSKNYGLSRCSQDSLNTHITIWIFTAKNICLSYISVNKKIMLFLCSNSWALCHEGARGSGCTDPQFLDLGTSWRWVVSLTPRHLYPGERAKLSYSYSYPIIRRCRVLVIEWRQTDHKQTVNNKGVQEQIIEKNIRT